MVCLSFDGVSPAHLVILGESRNEWLVGLQSEYCSRVSSGTQQTCRFGMLFLTRNHPCRFVCGDIPSEVTSNPAMPGKV
jgi:hypothetical protein